MKFSNTYLTAILAASIVTEAAPAKVESSNTNELQVAKRITLDELIAKLDALAASKSKRDEASTELEKKEYEIVTEVLSYLNDTNLAPKVIKYLATNKTLEPITISTIIAVIKSGLLNLNTLLDALVQSGLVNRVIEDVISDCSLYAKLFSLAKTIIGDLADKVEEKLSSKSKREVDLDSAHAQLVAKRKLDLIEDLDIEKRDSEEVLVNLLESLVGAVLASGSLNLSKLISAVKSSGLIGSLFRQIFSLNTLQTVATNAFAAFEGDCGSTSGSSGSSGSGSGSSSSGSLIGDLLGGGDKGSSGTTTTSTAGSGSGSGSNPCKKRRRRRRRTTNFY
ncbi:hypothetical protein QCA50_017022 [Cerrena zonata]|uniref:Opaque-phase-specific protein OP4 n=1 Tax=Cerrena zonata TaxID=2478898 RepID=A0AAW0FLN6_9APHY